MVIEYQSVFTLFEKKERDVASRIEVGVIAGYGVRDAERTSWIDHVYEFSGSFFRNGNTVTEQCVRQRGVIPGISYFREKKEICPIANQLSRLG